MDDRSDGRFPVVQSILSPDALLAVAGEFEIDAPVRCDFVRRGLNDTYIVRAGQESIFLRVYRANRRTGPEIEYEINLLWHLVAKGVSVPRPIPLRAGGYLRRVDAPEGIRRVALFTALPGQPPTQQGTGFIERYAAAIGEIHAASDDFTSRHPRPPLDLDYLLDAPLGALAAYLRDRPEDWSYVQRLAEKLRDRILSVAPLLDWGACHGDASLTNLHVMEDGRVAFFDFDNAGPGWRANDTAAFWGNAAEEGDEGLWRAFLRGYEAQHRFGDAEREILPAFHAARLFMSLGFHAANGIYWGVVRQREIVNEELTMLRHWDAAQLGGTNVSAS